MKEKKNGGESYISICVLVIFSAMIISMLLFFIGAVSSATSARDNIRKVMDGYIIKNSIEIYGNIKRGNDYVEELDKTAFVNSLVEEMGLVKEKNVFVKKTKNGNLLYRLTLEDIFFSEENSLKLISDVIVEIPVEVGGEFLSWLEIPMKIRSSYIVKV